ncbi:uncharacterized protein LOC141599859 [Silene latifolia]|uniref:uncharacterized protein LOC141599859 n=1 Tax=Silene latifolia TaxID=37657 RepID=UPI003D786116
MASYARCLLFLLFAISFFLEIHARESKLFSKVTKTTKKNNANEISLSPSVSPPTLAPALSSEPEVVEHGYGLYGRDPYENTPTKTVMPTKKTISGEQEKYVPAQELSQTENYGDNNYLPPSYAGPPPPYNNPPKSEMLTKNTILGDQKYVHVEQSSNNNVNGNKYEYSPSTRNPVYGEHNKYVSERQGMSDTRFLENGKYYYDVNQDSKDVSSFVENQGNNGYVPTKQGMSDTQFMDNGKYFYDVQNEEAVSNANNNNNEQFQVEKHGMSDTRYLDNGKYFYGLNNNENVNTNFPNQYVTQERKGNYGGTKKFPNEYDTMEEYDREQGYIDPQDVYVP